MVVVDFIVVYPIIAVSGSIILGKVCRNLLSPVGECGKKVVNL